MPYTVTKYPQGSFSWADFFSTDIEKSKYFLTSLFGWTSEDMPTGEGRPDYTMFSLNGEYVAGGSPTFMPNTPSFWSSYITVDNVDEMVSKAQELGATVTMPTMDVLDSGRMATIQDPTGAHVSLWQPKNHIGARVVNTIGAMGWNELYTKDIEKAKTFYSDLMHWTYDVNNESGYVMIQNNGRANGGMMSITPEMGSMPPNWTVYFTVKNRDDALVKVKELGGQVYMTKDLPIGKLAMIADPTGATSIIIEMAMPPDEWKE